MIDACRNSRSIATLNKNMINKKDIFWNFWTMKKVFVVLEKAKKESKMLSLKQIVRAGFPEAIGDKDALRFVTSNVSRRLGRNLQKGVVDSFINNFEKSKTVYYGLR
jgi:hypothetical protein